MTFDEWWEKKYASIVIYRNDPEMKMLARSGWFAGMYEEHGNCCTCCHPCKECQREELQSLLLEPLQQLPDKGSVLSKFVDSPDSSERRADAHENIADNAGHGSSDDAEAGDHSSDSRQK